MREDFNKLLTERERIGHRDSFHDVRGSKNNREFDEDAKGGKVSIHHHRRRSMNVNRKSFNENLNPLRCFIAGNVGRPWDKVFSELNKAFDRRKVVNNHIFEHLLDYVEINAKMIDGRVCVLNSYLAQRPWNAETHKYENADEGYYEARWAPIKEDATKWYVHPVDGLLKLNTNRKTNRQIKTQQKKELEAAVAKVFRKLNELEELYYEDGLWYLYTLAPRPKPYKRTYAPGLSDRQFNALSEADRKIIAKTEIVTPTVTERSPSKQYTRNGYMYYAAKTIASKKLLKTQGLDGTAGFDENVRTRSHRELARYR